ncbi:hypothetical protein GGD81_003794 [Rhodobium orientis]|uniref:Uncharacterized protein n=1 Tax=Rhodobium orientis TaxID=34017 RepID=A0A327JMD7_9HYPH|nr:hypothetical protein [Rhodobium orientis]MBB4304730.1 hypothetical protein [Rhodobium orientis]MBK5952066.1 hypothetical protein [Rhodobium orientis]RAI26533.1 hypothetical protein CH339_13785 [Rhodobium orientis]
MPSLEALAAVPLRPADQVMRLARMGAAFQTRLSFMRQLLRRMSSDRWRFERVRFDVDDNGFGASVYAAHGPERSYSLVSFTRDIPPEERTDRVIAKVWDGTFSLFDGIPTDEDIARLAENTPRQEAGRFRASELVLARGNKSLRLFEHVVERLSRGEQPDAEVLCDVGYLMRTTAVYGSGKFGCADRLKIAERPELAAPFQAEMLAVYLIRWLTIDLVNHVARCRGGDAAVSLDPDHARYLGIGNSTGLGMVPFLVKYPELIHNWVAARETALARVRAIATASDADIADFVGLIGRARRHVGEWRVEDAAQGQRIDRLKADLSALADWCGEGLKTSHPWDAAYRFAEEAFSPEGQELTVSLLLEERGDLVDDLGATMSANGAFALDPAMALGNLKDLIDTHYGWALGIDYDDPTAQERFWYYSEDKLEPRLGERFKEPGAEREMPLSVGRDAARLFAAVQARDPAEPVADFLIAHPEFRHMVRRVQGAAVAPYGEIRDNLLAAGVRPLDVLRFKLAFFGVSKFDPKSDLWTRVNMFQGAPLPLELASGWDGEWVFPVRPGAPPTTAGEGAL